MKGYKFYYPYAGRNFADEIVSLCKSFEIPVWKKEVNAGFEFYIHKKHFISFSLVSAIIRENGYIMPPEPRVVKGDLKVNKNGNFIFTEK